MPGATATNIRKADLAEDLGKLLLRQFCALAPISKSDDFGIDTIATLLEIDEQNSLREIANKTFGVQFKTKSVREIKFLKEYEFNWLLNLDYPYFICSVDNSNSSMHIYSLHMVNAMPGIKNNCDGLIITLDEKKDKQKKEDVLKLWLGDPIIDLSIHDILDKNLLNHKKQILKKWIVGEYDNIKIRNIGLTKAFYWETNKMPVFDALNKIFTSIENPDIYKECTDYLDAALFELKLFNENRELENSIEEINIKLKEKGVNLFFLNNIDFEAYRRKNKST